MDEVLGPPSPTFVSRGGTSIKSFKFREQTTSSSPPSISGESTRRRAFGMSGILGRRAKNQPLPDLNTLILAEKLLDAGEPSENLDPGLISSQRVTEPTSPASANKQPSSIFRKLTTKFNRNRAGSTSPPPANGANRRRSIAIPQANTGAWASQEARNAALRERGLLAPLPLSVQEAQQDRQIAIVASPEPVQQSGLERRQTAANRVKEEWEAKNRERMNGFRFGGNSPTQAKFPANGLEAVTELDTPLPSPLPSPTPDAHDSPSEFGADDDALEAKPPRAPPPTLNLSRGHGLSPPLMQAWSDDAPIDASLFPLPPSPTPGSAAESNFASLISAFTMTPAVDAGFTPMSPSFCPLPPSPSLSSPSFHSAFQDGTETPRAGGDATPKPPQSPTAPSMDENLLSPPSRSQSIPRMDGSETESSLGCVPSLIDSESQASIVSTTTESLPSTGAGFGRMRNVPTATKVRNSTIESDGLGHHAISVIVESPPEERDGADGIVLSESPIEEDAQQKAALMKPHDEAQVLAPAQVPRRRTTEPAPPPQAAAKADRRKSLNIFKKMSVRRPMGLGRAKSTAGPRAGVDTAALPPSPKLPAGLQQQQQQQQQRGRLASPPPNRQQHPLGLSPTMHNAGTILSEMNKIENEESRRMTELAFM